MRNLTETDQYKNGDKVADFLDNYFSKEGWKIERTTPHQERVLCLGDRIFTGHNKRFFIEYKSGQQTAHTGNIFLETVSVDVPCAPGWVYTCRADRIFYAILLSGKILVFEPRNLRAKIADLKTKFTETQTKGQNTYHTRGVLVPLDYAEKHLTKVVLIV